MMKTKESDIFTAKEILRQLGGNKFIAMTGAKNIAFGKNDNGDVVVTMKIMKNKSKANYLRITLNSMDLYDIDFIYMSMKSFKIKKTFSGIYFDQMRGLFEDVTELRTSLTEIYSY